jgi:hypothetical protein
MKMPIIEDETDQKKEDTEKKNETTPNSCYE